MSVIGSSFVNAYQTYDAVMGLLDNDERGAYVRFSDGEACILDGLTGIDTHQDSTPELVEGLKKAASVDDDAYLVAPAVAGKQETDERVMKAFPLTGLRWESLRNQDIFDQPTVYSMFWLHGPMFYEHEKVVNAIYALRERALGIVCGEHISQDMLDWLFWTSVVTVRGQLKHSADVLDRVDEEMQKYDGKIDTWVMALGAPAKVLQWRVWDRGDRTLTIDIGSAIEVLTRSGHARNWSWARRLDCGALMASLERAFGPAPKRR